MTKILYLIIGGSAGTLSRYFLSSAIFRICGGSFPYGTLAVNTMGCFIVGALFSLAEKKFLLEMNLRLLLVVGFCGAFTTFSTLMLETNNLVKDGEVLKAFMNLILSVTLGFILFRAGVILGENV
jgi:fluoride exporter